MRVTLFLLILLLCPLTFAATSGELWKCNSNGETRFFATGKPSSLKINGKGSHPTCEFTLNENQLTGKFTFALDQLKTGIDLRDSHMKEKYLEVAKYPTATLIFEKVKLPTDWQKTDKPFSTMGKLDLHGKEKEIPVEIKWISKNTKEFEFSGTFKVLISDFAINVPSFAGVTVADEVRVEVDGAATSKP